LPVTYTIDPERQLVVTTITEPATEGDVLEHNRLLRHDPLFDRNYRQLADMTDVAEVTVSAQTIRETARDQFFAAGVRRAFVAKDDGPFGMARMYAIHAESFGQVIEVFRDRCAAEAWLGLTDPATAPATTKV
jgi:hypothetical protein